MKKELLLISALSVVLSLSACNYNNYDRETTPYRGSIPYQHFDETVVRPKKTKTMTVSRQATHIDDLGNRHDEEFTETVTVPEDLSNAADIERAQRAINPTQNRIQIDVNKSYEYK